MIGIQGKGEGWVKSWESQMESFFFFKVMVTIFSGGLTFGPLKAKDQCITLRKRSNEKKSKRVDQSITQLFNHV